MLHVALEHILTEEDAMSKINSIIEEVENQNETYVITKNGRPAVAIVNVTKLDEVTEGTTEQAKTDPATNSQADTLGDLVELPTSANPNNQSEEISLPPMPPSMAEPSLPPISEVPPATITSAAPIQQNPAADITTQTPSSLPNQPDTQSAVLPSNIGQEQNVEPIPASPQIVPQTIEDDLEADLSSSSPLA